MPGSKKLIDIIDEMNWKESTTNNMVVDKLDKLARLIYGVSEYNEDADFVSNIMENLIQSPHKRITRIEIEECNNIYKQYKERK